MGLRGAVVAVAAIVVMTVAQGAAQAAGGVRLVDHDGRCLDVGGDGRALTAACEPLRAEQRWQVQAFDADSVVIVNDASGRCLRSSGYPAEGTVPYLDTCPVAGPRPADFTTWVSVPATGGATRLLAGNRYALVSTPGGVRMQYKDWSPGAEWTATAPGVPNKPGEGGSCGVQACPPE
jgi:hypothetical protein